MMEYLLNAIISPAYAQSAADAQGGGLSFAIMLMVFLVFTYFAIIRPQNKRAKEQQLLLNGLVKGDEVVTAGGILGRITNISDNYITLSIASNTEIHMQKSSIVTVLPKGTLKTIE